MIYTCLRLLCGTQGRYTRVFGNLPSCFANFFERRRIGERLRSWPSRSRTRRPSDETELAHGATTEARHHSLEVDPDTCIIGAFDVYLDLSLSIASVSRQINKCEGCSYQHAKMPRELCRSSQSTGSTDRLGRFACGVSRPLDH